ncbi:MAG: hypothetical protein DI589_22350 [Shinella sp.]|jgi:hypothetical protein|nr:MAG: hypothetical protein DI589_22350 [Shinella sp.]
MNKPLAAIAPPRERLPSIQITPGFRPTDTLLRQLRSPKLEAFMLCNIGFWTAFAIADLWCRYG